MYLWGYGRMIENPMYLASPEPIEDETIESLSIQVDELTGKVSSLMQFINEQFDACACENCGHLHPRKHMVAVYGIDSPNGIPQPNSSRWFCGFCSHSAAMKAGNFVQECRDRLGKWFAVGYGRTFLREQSGPVTEFITSNLQAEIQSAAKRWSR